MLASTILAVVSAVTTVVGAAIQPIPGTTPTNDLQTILLDASNIFAYELIGGAHDVVDARTLCSTGFRQRGYAQTLSTMGLKGENIEAIVCLESSAYILDPTAYIASRIRPFNSEIFALQVVNAFNRSDVGLTNMCNMLSSDALEQFNIDPSVVMGAICGAANLPAPEVVTPVTQNINKTAVNQFYKAVSALYAFELAYAANTTELLTEFCADSPNHIDRLGALGLDGQCISETICSIHTPLTAGQAINAAIYWSTQIFITVLKNIPSNYFFAYDSYICKWVVDQGLQGVALDAAAVRKAFSC